MCPNSHKLKCPNKIFIRRLTLENLFIMSKKELFVYDLIIKVKEKRISQMKASELLHISDRHFRRLWKAYKTYGLSALISKKRGKPSNNRLPEKLYKRSIFLIKKNYKGFGPTLANEKLLENHKIKISVETMDDSSRALE